MARSLDPDQQAALTDFVNELARLAGYKTTAEWSRESGYPQPNLSNLRNGKGAIDGFNLLRLIQAAAERDGGHAAKKAMRAATVGSQIDHLQETLDDLQQKMNRLLSIRRSQGARPGTAGDAPKRREGR